MHEAGCSECQLVIFQAEPGISYACVSLAIQQMNAHGLGNA